jgi:hypothetical protein
MATNTPNWGIDPYSNFNFTYKDVAIGGKMVTGTIRVSEDKMMVVQSDPMLKEYMRNAMAVQMGEYMISNGLVEFTQMRDSISFDTIVKARCYLAPNDQVKILRMHHAGT